MYYDACPYWGMQTANVIHIFFSSKKQCVVTNNVSPNRRLIGVQLIWHILNVAEYPSPEYIYSNKTFSQIILLECPKTSLSIRTPQSSTDQINEKPEKYELNISLFFLPNNLHILTFFLKWRRFWNISLYNLEMEKGKIRCSEHDSHELQVQKVKCSTEYYIISKAY